MCKLETLSVNMYVYRTNGDIDPISCACRLINDDVIQAHIFVQLEIWWYRYLGDATVMRIYISFLLDTVELEGIRKGDE